MVGEVIGTMGGGSSGRDEVEQVVSLGEMRSLELLRAARRISALS